MILPLNYSGEVRNEGKYDPLPYKFWGYPLDARNLKEDEAAAAFYAKPAAESTGRAQADPAKRQMAKKLPNPISARPIEPETRASGLDALA